MKKRELDLYTETVEKKMEDKKCDLHLLRDDLLVKISFYQHERLIHFLVTMMTSILTVIILIGSLLLDNVFMYLLLLVLVCLLIPYYFYYYYLENKVQSMYTLYDKLRDKINKQ